MPKRREELRKISLAEREYAIIDAIRKNGMASIEDVVKSLISRFELDLTDSNAKAALTKSVRIYLQKSAENGDMLGRAYFRKGKGDPEKIPNEDLERDERGKVKNKYNIKYFLRGSNHHVPGGNLIIESGGLFFPHANSNGDFSAEWQISRFQKVKPHHFHFVFKGSYGHYLALSAPTSDAPFSLIIGRAVMGQKPFLQVSDLDERFKRPSILLLDESSVSSPKGSRPGHAIIMILKSTNIFLEDLNSTNGTFCTNANESDLNKTLVLSEEFIGTAGMLGFAPESNKNSWTKLTERTQISSLTFVRFGSFEALVFTT